MYDCKDKDELQNEIIELKKQNLVMQKQNCLLNVRIRKLETQLKRKEMELYNLADSYKTYPYGHGKMIAELHEKIIKFEKLIFEKNIRIKRLQDQLRMTNVYSANNKSTIKKQDHFDGSFIRRIASLINLSYSENSNDNIDNKNCPTPQSSSSSPNRSRSSFSQTILEVNKTYQTIKPEVEGNEDKTSNQENDMNNTELYNSDSHVEIQKLQSSIYNMFLELESLKSTIDILKNENYKTNLLLKEKDINMEELAEEINILRLDNCGQKNSVTKRVRNASSLKNYGKNCKCRFNKKL